MMRLDLSAPDYTTLSRRSQHLRHRLRPVPTDEGIHLVLDSTGLSIVGEGEWAAAKHGGRGRRGWRKLHLGVDQSGVIRVHTLTEETGDDATTALDLLTAVEGLSCASPLTPPMTRSPLGAAPSPGSERVACVRVGFPGTREASSSPSYRPPGGGHRLTTPEAVDVAPGVRRSEPQVLGWYRRAQATTRRGDGRRGVGVSQSTAEAGESSPRDPVEGRGPRQVAPVEGKTANPPRLGPVSTSRHRIAELARHA